MITAREWARATAGAVVPPPYREGMGKHTDVVTYPRDESPFGTELPVPGFIHRVPRPGAHGGVATMVIEAVELDGDDVRATITTYDGPLCLVHSSPSAPTAGVAEAPTLFEADAPAGSPDPRRSHPASRTTTLPPRAESPSGA